MEKSEQSGLSIEELGDYLETINKELSVRQAKLSSVDKEVAELKFQLEQLAGKSRWLKGKALDIAGSEAYRKKLKRLLKVKNRERELVLEDVSRALERKKGVEQELASLT